MHISWKFTKSGLLFKQAFCNFQGSSFSKLFLMVTTYATKHKRVEWMRYICRKKCENIETIAVTTFRGTYQNIDICFLYGHKFASFKSLYLSLSVTTPIEEINIFLVSLHICFAPLKMKIKQKIHTLCCALPEAKAITTLILKTKDPLEGCTRVFLVTCFCFIGQDIDGIFYQNFWIHLFQTFAVSTSKKILINTWSRSLMNSRSKIIFFS